MPRLKGSADLLEDRRKRALALLDSAGDCGYFPCSATSACVRRGRTSPCNHYAFRHWSNSHFRSMFPPIKTVWAATLRRAKIPYFRIYDLRSTYATRLSAGGVADEWVTQMLRQGDAKVFNKYSQMKLQMKREALQKLHRHANESQLVLVQAV